MRGGGGLAEKKNSCIPAPAVAHYTTSSELKKEATKEKLPAHPALTYIILLYTRSSTTTLFVFPAHHSSSSFFIIIILLLLLHLVFIICVVH